MLVFKAAYLVWICATVMRFPQTIRQTARIRRAHHQLRPGTTGGLGTIFVNHDNDNGNPRLCLSTSRSITNVYNE